MLSSLKEKKGFAVQANRGTQAKTKMRMHVTLGNSQQKRAVPLIQCQAGIFIIDFSGLLLVCVLARRDSAAKSNGSI